MKPAFSRERRWGRAGEVLALLMVPDRQGVVRQFGGRRVRAWAPRAPPLFGRFSSEEIQERKEPLADLFEGRTW